MFGSPIQVRHSFELPRRAFIAANLAMCLGTTDLLGADTEPPKRLFDGKSFDGWEGNLDVFRIEGEALVGGSLKQPIPRNEFLCTRETFEDFELTLDVKLLGEGANAGIQIRSARIPNHHEVRGYQADAGDGWWGKLYDESRRNRILAELLPGLDAAQFVRPGDWNAYQIRCEGPRIQIWVNQTRTVDYTEMDSQIPRNGIIGVQIHAGPPSEAWYRNIELRRLA